MFKILFLKTGYSENNARGLPYIKHWIKFQTSQNVGIVHSMLLNTKKGRLPSSTYKIFPFCKHTCIFIMKYMQRCLIYGIEAIQHVSYECGHRSDCQLTSYLTMLKVLGLSSLEFEGWVNTWNALKLYPVIVLFIIPITKRKDAKSAVLIWWDYGCFCCFIFLECIYITFNCKKIKCKKWNHKKITANNVNINLLFRQRSTSPACQNQCCLSTCYFGSSYCLISINDMPRIIK